MLLAAMIGTLSLSNSTILYTTRVPATMAEDGYLPQWLGRIHPRYGTPVRAIAVSLVVYCVLARFDVEDLVNIYIWTRIATTILTLFAAWQMRRKDPSAPRAFRIPGGKLGLAYVLIFPVILCALKVAQSEDYVWRWAPWLLATGPAAYLILRYGFKLKPHAEISGAPHKNSTDLPQRTQRKKRERRETTSPPKKFSTSRYLRALSFLFLCVLCVKSRRWPLLSVSFARALTVTITATPSPTRFWPSSRGAPSRRRIFLFDPHLLATKLFLRPLFSLSQCPLC